jgi:hypothetical protein
MLVMKSKHWATAKSLEFHVHHFSEAGPGADFRAGLRQRSNEARTQIRRQKQTFESRDQLLGSVLVAEARATFGAVSAAEGLAVFRDEPSLRPVARFRPAAWTMTLIFRLVFIPMNHALETCEVRATLEWTLTSEHKRMGSIFAPAWRRGSGARDDSAPINYFPRSSG